MFDVHQTTAPAYAVTVDGDTFIYSAANHACIEMAGLTATFIPGLDPHACFSEAVAKEVLGRYRACRDTRQAITYVLETRLQTGLRRWRTTLFPITDASGKVIAIIGIGGEAPEQVEADQKLETKDERLALALGAMDGGFWVYEMATGVFETSASLARYLAGPGHESLNLAEYCGYVHAEDLRGPEILRSAGDRSTADYRVITFDGRARWLQSRRRVIRDKTGAIVRVIGLVMDVTEQKKAMTVLECEASTDALTLLKNRRAFDRAARAALADTSARHAATAIVLIDLDGFKPVNDRYGHRAGDEMLRKVAKRLARVVGDTHVLGRLGGDEFAILVENATDELCETLATRIVTSLERPFRLDTRQISISASVGLATATTANITLAALLELADRNLYAAKREKRRLTA